MGGVAAHYASWRDAQWLLAAMGFFAVVPIALWLPETLDPEKLQRVKDEGKRLTSLNPFRSLAVLRSPIVMMMVRLFGS